MSWFVMKPDSRYEHRYPGRTRYATSAGFVNMIGLLLAAATVAVHSPADAADSATTFSPAAGVKATLTVRDQQVELTVTGPRGRTTETLPFETEQPLRIKVDDYNFDGHTDFSVSHVDDGKGTYDLYDIYVYAPKTGKFERLAPACGEDFINVRLDRKRRALINTRVENYRFTSCRMTFQHTLK